MYTTFPPRLLDAKHIVILIFLVSSWTSDKILHESNILFNVFEQDLNRLLPEVLSVVSVA